MAAGASGSADNGGTVNMASNQRPPSARPISRAGIGPIPNRPPSGIRELLPQQVGLQHRPSMADGNRKLVTTMVLSPPCIVLLVAWDDVMIYSIYRCHLALPDLGPVVGLLQRAESSQLK
ncbi:unnamed protein product [Ranitomeya imitator]|uniref:Uncharacterized protein n=1 Tax=Ranitomeya imitator TaxID=111125 RepID=A0ABN9LIU5_9NEOB|nr:unnamed protein product [Ranitomeya imitator]